jgi:phosphatidylglycerophosphate synthase
LTSTPPIRRIQDNMLAASERRLLNWLCARLPAWITPDHLTVLGLVAAAIIFGGYAASAVNSNWLWLAVAGYFLHWFGDSLDGSVARFRGIERPKFGYFVDHSADALGTLLILGGLGLSPFVRLDVALLALAGYYLLAIHSFLGARVTDELKLSYIAAGPTEMRLILIVLTALMYIFGNAGPRFLTVGPFDLFVGAVAAVMVVLFATQTFILARKLARQGG